MAQVRVVIVFVSSLTVDGSLQFSALSVATFCLRIFPPCGNVSLRPCSVPNAFLTPVEFFHSVLVAPRSATTCKLRRLNHLTFFVDHRGLKRDSVELEALLVFGAIQLCIHSRSSLKAGYGLFRHKTRRISSAPVVYCSTRSTRPQLDRQRGLQTNFSNRWQTRSLLIGYVSMCRSR